MSTSKPLCWRDRPEEVKKTIYEKWIEIKERTKGWLWNGDYKYYLGDIDEQELIKAMIINNPEKNEFYILDIGAGDFKLGRGLVNYLNSTKAFFQNKKFHVISIGGEARPGPEQQTIGRCTLYELGGFLIENLEDELVKREISLTNTVDIILSFSKLCNF